MTGSHYYCAGFNHFTSIGSKIEAMNDAFGEGHRQAARQELAYIIAEAQLWHDELREDKS